MQTTSSMSLNAPASKAFRPKPRAPVAPSEPDSVVPEIGAAPEVEEEDEEVRLAMEMALAAAQNPHLSVMELRKLVASKNQSLSKQAEIVEKVQLKKEMERQREREEQQRRWSEQKEKMVGFWKGRAEAVVSGVSEVKKAAERKAEELQDQYERRLYAEEIHSDREILECRKRIRFMQKALKAHRLQGNREETRHSFKRQRQEKKLLQLYEKVDKTTRLFTASSYNVHEYAKAMMRASKKWNKKSSSDQELALEAQLCRNMHQMLAIEKQKSKLKKSTKEMKKYLQRCKGWLSDKKALCEMHIMTLDATSNSMMIMYEDTLDRQDALIERLKASEEFAGVDLASVELGPGWRELHMLQEHHDRSHMVLGPSATLAALRGLPINDSIRLRRTALEKDEHKTVPPPAAAKRAPAAANEFFAPSSGPQLFIETKDDASVSSHLSDPDEDPNDPRQLDGGNGGLPSSESYGDSQSDMGFDKDAPWMAQSTTGHASSIEEEEAEDEAQKSKYTAAIIGPKDDDNDGGDDAVTDDDAKKPPARKAPLSAAPSRPAPTPASTVRNESPPSVVVTTEALVDKPGADMDDDDESNGHGAAVEPKSPQSKGTGRVDASGPPTAADSPPPPPTDAATPTAEWEDLDRGNSPIDDEEVEGAPTASTAADEQQDSDIESQ